MRSVQRTGVYALFLGLCLGTLSPLSAKEGSRIKVANSSTDYRENNRATAATPLEFQWSEHKTLTWDDFRGSVSAQSSESAAATHCGIGFRTCRPEPGVQPQIIVYNTFYVNKSWVRSDARLASILAHEQGHFDLCELYTRELRKRLAGVDLTADNARYDLERIYMEVKNEYERRQEAYEDETTHGTNFAYQSQWHGNIARELAASEEHSGDRQYVLR